MVGIKDTQLPEPVAAFISAVNAGNFEAIVDTFADTALVNDDLHEHRNREAIAEWAKRAIIGQRLSMAVQRIVRNNDHTVIEATVDGSYDKRGLPDPLVLSFYFSAHEGKVDQLLILRKEPALASAG